MKYAITAALSLMFLTGCGGTGNGAGSLPKPTAACVNGFRNDAGIPTGESGPVVALSPTSSTLWNLWNAAQHDLSTEPIPYLDGHTEPPIVACATVQPDCQAVVAVPDLTDQQLAQLTGDKKWLQHAEPTGVFMCDGVPVYGCYVGGVVYVGASIAWNSTYEIENAILPKCGGSNAGR